MSTSAALTARGMGLVMREASRAALDRRRPSTGPVPLHPSGVTPRWLESTLGLRHGSVRSVALLDEDSGTAARARIAIEADPAAGLPEVAFVKSMPRNYLQHVLMNAFDLGTREVHAYRALGDEPPVRIPRCYAAVVDDRRHRNIMILEDLGPSARFRTVADSLSAQEAEAMVDALADLHAAYWESGRFTRDMAPLAGRSGVANALGDVIRRQLLGKPRGAAAELVPGWMRHQSRIFFEQSERIDAFWARQPQTLIHGDPHLGNLFFIGDAPGLLDWQVATINAGIRDVAYFATASVSPDLLRSLERGLVERYAARLGAAGVEVDVEGQWTLYRAGVTELYLAAVSTAGSGERMQPAEVSRAGVERAVAAVEAHDSFELLADLITSGGTARPSGGSGGSVRRP